MSPAFNSWAEFFAMGGYAFFVWLAVSVAACTLLGLVIHTLWRRRCLLREIMWRNMREQRIQQAKTIGGEHVSTP